MKAVAVKPYDAAAERALFVTSYRERIAQAIDAVTEIARIRGVTREELPAIGESLVEVAVSLDCMETRTRASKLAWKWIDVACLALGMEGENGIRGPVELSIVLDALRAADRELAKDAEQYEQARAEEAGDRAVSIAEARADRGLDR